jgi:hypothetical protein
VEDCVKFGSYVIYDEKDEMFGRKVCIAINDIKDAAFAEKRYTDVRYKACRPP